MVTQNLSKKAKYLSQNAACTLMQNQNDVFDERLEERFILCASQTARAVFVLETVFFFEFFI